MPDLIGFIQARLADDEEAAREASSTDWYLAQPASCGCCLQIRARDGYGSLVCTLDDRDAAHVVRHDPARVLREVEAKRKIIARYQASLDYDNAEDEARCWLLGEIVGVLASAWSDHPDYDPGWATAAG